MCSQQDEGQESLEEELDDEGDQVSNPSMVCPPATPKIVLEEGGPYVPAVCQSSWSSRARDPSLSRLALGGAASVIIAS